MSDTPSDPLILHPRTRPVLRFNRKLIMIGAGVGSAALLGATLFTLESSGARNQSYGKEVYNVDRKTTADGLNGMPRNYDGMGKPTPVLGPPLQGDVGAAALQKERELGTAPQPVENFTFRPTAEDDAARAERLRLARQALQAREAAVFFQTNAKRQGSNNRPPTDPALAMETAGGTSPAADRLELDPDRDQNNQQRKLNFLNSKPDAAIYNPHSLQTPVSPYQVMAGSVISASLVTGINSDLPGTVIAQVTEHVYDSPTGRHLLVPQGSRLIGKYDSVVAFGQSRALVVWNRIVMPDGTSMVIDNLPGTDTAGYAGLEDEVDYHTWRLITGVVLSTLLGVGTELSLGDDESDLVRALRRSTQQNTNRAGQRITERNLNLQPTITIRQGFPVRVIVNKDLVLKPYRG
jgi:type IV secretion system protein VirB10